MTSFSLPAALSRILHYATAGAVLSTMCLGVATAQSIKSGDVAPFEVVYEVGNNLISAGDARLKLSNKGDLWEYSLDIKPKGVFKLAGKGRIHEESTFTLRESGDEVFLQPQQYRYRQDDERRRKVDASFDWDDNTVTYKYRGKTVTESFTTPLLDRLTVTLLIMNALRHDFDEVELPVFDSAKIKQVDFVNEGHEYLKTRRGRIDTIRVTNRNATGGSRETTTWFAPSLDYLPVKIEHKKRDELVVRLSLISLKNRVTSLELGEALPVDEAIDDEELSDSYDEELPDAEELSDTEVLPDTEALPDSAGKEAEVSSKPLKSE